MRAFSRRRGMFVAHVEPEERSILAGVVADTATLLGESPRIEERSRPDPDDRGPAHGSDPAAGGAGDGPQPKADMEELEADLDRLGENLPEPTDPALARLLPAASDDEEVAGEFRRLTQEELRNEKLARLHMVWAGLRAPGTKLSIDPDDAMDWAAALTDVRLVLSERLGIRTDADAEEVYALSSQQASRGESQEDEVRLAMASVYAAFTWLQESLTQVMLPTLGD